MQNLKTPQGTVKKGIAHFGKTTTTTGLTIAQYSAIPFGETTFFNDSNNISLLSSTQIKLLAGKKYKLTGDVGVLISATTENDCQFYNVTTGTYIGSKQIQVPPSNIDPVPLFTKACVIINCTQDTIIEYRNIGITNINYLYTGSSIVVEELEAYLIPTDPTKYTDVINITSATGDILIPSGLPIGTKKLYRKVNATVGNVNITCAGETFTEDSIGTLVLYDDGDTIEIEKVTSTMWGIIGGTIAITQTAGTSSGKIATTSFVSTAVSSKAPLASPALTGTPTAPTATTGTNTTQLATTAYANAIAGGTTIPAISKATNGYMKLANGMIIQWGQTASGTNSTTFPIAFPSVCGAVTLTSFYSNEDNAKNLATTSLTGFTTTANYGMAIRWIAIGY